MDAAVRDLGIITPMAGGNGKGNEQHSKIGLRDMLSGLGEERGGKGAVLGAGAEWWLCGASALDGQCKG